MKCGIMAGLLWSVVWSGAAPPRDGEQQSGRKKPNRSFVWQVEGEANTIYLAGSMHLLRGRDLPLPKAFGIAYEDSGRLLFEISPAESESPEAMKRAMEKGRYENGKTLRDAISKEAYAELCEYVEEVGMPAGAWDGVRPWMAMMSITLVEIAKMGALAEFGVEKVIGDKAKKDGKKVTGLETLEKQLGIFETLDAKVQEKMLVKALHERETLAEDYPRMVTSWKNGDDKAFMEMAFDGMDDSEAGRFYEKILYERNREWVGSIEKILSGSENVMVVVGAGHLLGERGLVDLLRKKGYEVKRVPGSSAKKPDSALRPNPNPGARNRHLVPEAAIPGAA